MQIWKQGLEVIYKADEHNYLWHKGASYECHRPEKKINKSTTLYIRSSITLRKSGTRKYIMNKYVTTDTGTRTQDFKE